MQLIVAVDKAWAIGYKGNTLVEIPADRKLFWQSRDARFDVKGAIVCRDMGAALKVCAGYPSEDVSIIGGQEIYQAFLPYCDVAHVTFIDHIYNADTYFSDLSKDPEWELAAESEEQTYFDLCYTFRMYRRKSGS